MAESKYAKALEKLLSAVQLLNFAMTPHASDREVDELVRECDKILKKLTPEE